jgi:hypothetical protein
VPLRIDVAIDKITEKKKKPIPPEGWTNRADRFANVWTTKTVAHTSTPFAHPSAEYAALSINH